METTKNLHGMLLSSCCNTPVGTLINKNKKIRKNEEEFPPECLVVWQFVYKEIHQYFKQVTIYFNINTTHNSTNKSLCHTVDLDPLYTPHHALANPSKLCYVMTVSSVKDVVRWRSLELAPPGSGWRSPLVLTAESGGGSTVMWSSLSSSLSLLWLFSWRRARWISLGNRDIWKVRVNSLQGQKQQAVSTLDLVGTLES